MWGQPPPGVRRAQPGSCRCDVSTGRMRKIPILVLCAVLGLELSSCSPRDFLSRRLATDLITASDPFRTPQHFALQTGTVSNKDYVSPEYLVLQQHGWISASAARCSPGMAPPPCWDVFLTPAGVEHGAIPCHCGRGGQDAILHSRRQKGTGGRHWDQQAGQPGRRRLHMEMGPVERSRSRSLFGRPTLRLERRVSRVR